MFGLGSLFGLGGGGSTPGAGAQEYLSKIPGTIKPYLEPYSQAGQESLGQLQEQLGRMTQDPSDLLAQFGQGYRESPGYQYGVNQAVEAANRAAAAGGQLGSPAEQEVLAQHIGGMFDQDYGNYLSNVMGLYGQGVKGLTGLTGLGEQAGGRLGEDLASNLMGQANLDYTRDLNRQSSLGGLFGLLGSGIGSALPEGGGTLGTAGNFFRGMTPYR